MIFEGGYNLKKTLVFKNFVYIALYGILGTIIAFFVVTGLTFAVNNLGSFQQYLRPHSRFREPGGDCEAIHSNNPYILCYDMCN